MYAFADTTRSPHGVCNIGIMNIMLVTVTDTTRSPHGVCNTAVCFHSNHEGAIQPAPLTGSATGEAHPAQIANADTTRSPHGVCNDTF